MVVATNAVAKHANMADASVVGDRAFAWFSRVTAVRIAPGMDSSTRSAILPMIIAVVGWIGAPGSCSAPRPSCHTSMPGLKHVSTNATSFSTANRPRCLVMRTA
jgi:hypothetical protein